uniref:Uncharacterized protein n=1 Tax=Avena sativa TaxID=4498 RepID=A0ACD6A6A2_AVESA
MPPPVPMDEPVEDVLFHLPPVLMDELVEEVLLRLPPDEPAWLVRASAACKPWRHILADPGFRRRYREFHRTPPVLGFFDCDARFIPTSSLLPAPPDPALPPSCISLDCRHGRALFADYGKDQPTFDLIVLDPLSLKGHQSHVPFPVEDSFRFSAAVLCAAQGCDHHGCQGGCFFVALVATDDLVEGVTSGWLYSSETRVWSELTSVHHPNVKCVSHLAEPSVLVGDALYFNADGIIEFQLGMHRLSMFEKPIHRNGHLMKAEDGGLAFAAMVDDDTNLIMWSIDTGLDGAMEWEKLRVIDLKTLLPDGALWIPALGYGISSWPGIFLSASAEGTQVIFVSICTGFYMVDLKSGRAKKVSRDHRRGEKCFPYVNFYIPAMEEACTSQGQ